MKIYICIYIYIYKNTHTHTHYIYIYIQTQAYKYGLILFCKEGHFFFLLECFPWKDLSL